MKDVKFYSGSFLICILFACIIIQGCKKDEEVNYMVFDGVRYNISRGLLMKYGQYDPGEGYNFGLMLYSNGITYSATTNTWSGTGHFLYFEMYSESDTDLATGTYDFEDTYGLAYMPFTFSFAVVGVDVDLSSDLKKALTKSYKSAGSDVYHYFADGSVRVKKSKSTYTVNIDGITEESKAVKGVFEGAMMLVEADQGK